MKTATNKDNGVTIRSTAKIKRALDNEIADLPYRIGGKSQEYKPSMENVINGLIVLYMEEQDEKKRDAWAVKALAALARWEDPSVNQGGGNLPGGRKPKGGRGAILRQHDLGSTDQTVMSNDAPAGV